jgi:lipopolysaccharide export system permease protein
VEAPNSWWVQTVMFLLFPRIFEKYLARQIYANFLFILFALIALFIFFDYLNEVNNLRGNYTNYLAFIHILLKSPSRLVELIPMAGLIGAIYVFAQMASQSEFTILRMAGLNSSRGLWTLFKIGIPIIITTFVLSEWVGPYCDTKAEEMRSAALNEALGNSLKTGTWIKDKLKDPDGIGPEKPGIRFVNVGNIKNRGEISQIRMYEFNEHHQLQVIREAMSGSYDEKGFWNLRNVTETRVIEYPKENPLDTVYRSTSKTFQQQRLQSEVTPDILAVLLISPERMSIINLNRFINHLEDNQQNSQAYQLALWKKLIYPFTILVMLCLALPFGYLHARSGGISLKVFGGIILGMSFILFNTLFSHIGLLGSWPPFITAVIPLGVYLIMAFIALIWVARR